MSTAAQDVIVYLIRHGIAKDRSHWNEDDLLRPLTTRGARQAELIAERMREVNVGKVVSSPFLRCFDTVAPLAAQFGIKVETVKYLSEGGDERAGLRELLKLASVTSPLVVVACSHGDVIPAILDLLIAQGAKFSGTHAVRKGASFELTGTNAGFTEIVGISPPSPS